MELNEKKIGIIALLMDIDNIHLLDLLEEIIAQYKSDGDWWDELPESEQDVLNQRMHDSETQEAIPNEEVMNAIYSEFKFIQNEL